MKKNAPGCNCCSPGCEILCSGTPRMIRGWHFFVSGIPNEMITYNDGSGLIGTEMRTKYTGYAVFNNGYTLYYDEECVIATILRDDNGTTCIARRTWSGTPGECYCGEYTSEECCVYTMRLVVSLDTVYLVTTYNGLDPICTASGSPSVDNVPFVFEADMAGNYCVKKTVEVPFNITDTPRICENCTYVNDSGIITVERTPIFA